VKRPGRLRGWLIARRLGLRCLVCDRRAGHFMTHEHQVAGDLVQAVDNMPRRLGTVQDTQPYRRKGITRWQAQITNRSQSFVAQSCFVSAS
jgi:hypothetical protein